VELPAFARSVTGARIRLNEKRWGHISEEHSEVPHLIDEVIGTIANPETVVAGAGGELLAVRSAGDQRWLVVVYRENSGDGFVITAFLTSRWRSIARRRQLRPR
jgi:hypothetical protein